MFFEALPYNQVQPLPVTGHNEITYTHVLVVWRTGILEVSRANQHRLLRYLEITRDHTACLEYPLREERTSPANANFRGDHVCNLHIKVIYMQRSKQL